MTLAELRRQLVTARDVLRAAHRWRSASRGPLWQRAVEGGATGKNAEERERALLALEKDWEYLESRNRLDSAEYEVDRISAEIAILDDDRKARELACRERANEVLDRLAAAYERMAPTDSVALERSAVDTALPF